MSVPQEFRDHAQRRMRWTVRRRRALRGGAVGGGVVLPMVLVALVVGWPGGGGPGTPGGSPGPATPRGPVAGGFEGGASSGAEAAVESAPHEPSPAVASRIVVRRVSGSGGAGVKRLSDAELLQRLEEAGRPAGFISSPSGFQIVEVASGRRVGGGAAGSAIP